MASVRIFRHYIRLPFLILLVVELIVFLAAIYVGAEIRFSGDADVIERSVGGVINKAMIFSFVMIASMGAMGLYKPHLREGLSGNFLRISASFFIGSIALTLIFYLFPFTFLGRGVLAIANGISFVIVVIVRVLFIRHGENSLKRNIIILGSGDKAQEILNSLRREADRKSFNLIGFIHIRGEKDVVSVNHIINLNSSLLNFSLKNNIDEIVIAVDDRRKSFPLHELLDCRMSGIDVIEVLTFFEREMGKIRVDLLHPSWLVFSDGFQESVYRDYVKRFVDISASAILLFLTWPIMLITIVAIYIESNFKGPFLYSQIRIGENGKPFAVLKFRSMSVNAEKDGGAQWAQKNDSRVTKVGSFIRKVRIDELPQIFNVFKGDMSFVGPRPERPEFVVMLNDAIPYFEERHRVKPGITGWAQLCYPYGASEKDSLEKLQYDLYYVKNHSTILDFLVLVQTAEVILFGKGR
ncbi:FIG071646: Sugar transferase [hydrothermal vent metagenome]|uniref:FIG071646: Sugar transferase n=1 Tax=hydrothermal vent metagenome TaxID=652676 RepID=A0A3B1AR72_9ZZZZ